MNKKLTSIQVSVEHRDALKKYCDEQGYNMNRFVEKFIEKDANMNNIHENIKYITAEQARIITNSADTFERELKCILSLIEHEAHNGKNSIHCVVDNKKTFKEIENLGYKIEPAIDGKGGPTQISW